MSALTNGMSKSHSTVCKQVPIHSVSHAELSAGATGEWEWAASLRCSICFTQPVHKSVWRGPHAIGDAVGDGKVVLDSAAHEMMFVDQSDSEESLLLTYLMLAKLQAYVRC